MAYGTAVLIMHYAQGANVSFQIEHSYQATHRILSLYQFYRLSLSVLLVIIITYNVDSDLLIKSNKGLFRVTCWIYFVCTIISLLLPLTNRISLVLSLIFFDITTLSILFYASGGVGNGIANLIVVTVAIANTLFRGQIGLFIAAISSLTIISITVILSLSSPIPLNDYIQAGTLGALCFISATLIQSLMARMKVSEALAKQKASDVANLQLLNSLIVEQMPSGALLINKDGQIIMANNEAHRLLDEPLLDGLAVSYIFPELYIAIKQWLNNPKLELQPLQPAKKHTSKVRPTLTHTKHSNKLVILVFLESMDVIAKQVQQIKLASLGHLTASIAHEIRNPLGALSHAAQLLKESENMDEQDHRLLQIILNNSSRLNSIIANVLQLSRKKQTLNYQYEMMPLELTQWVTNFVSEFHETATNQIIHLDIESKPIYTYAIPSQLHQILTNLTSNGLRHTKHKEGIAEIWLMIYIDKNSQLPQLDVLDNGDGVPLDLVDKMFEPFFTTNTDGTGTGLGLFVTKELCEYNQAQLSYLPRKGGGSCFRVTFASAAPLF